MDIEGSTRICIVEPFYTGSHAYWANGLCAHMETNVELVKLAGDGWRKSMQKSAPLLATKVANLGFVPDLILLSSMTNAEDFSRALPDSFANTPIVLYMHENQFGYPGSKSGNKFAEINWVSMKAADKIVVNSQFHLRQLREKITNQYGADRAKPVLAKASVLPIGINQHPNLKRESSEKPVILFNHRWEFDKQPDVALDALCQASVATGGAFDVALCGEHYPGLSKFGQAEEVLRDSIQYEGFLDEGTYAQCLSEADVVVSTSVHEYFGISVAEAILAGAIPVLPNSLSYPELVPESHHKHCLYEPSSDPSVTATNCANSLVKVLKTWRNLDTKPLVNSISQYRWPQVAQQYDAYVAELINSATT